MPICAKGRTAREEGDYLALAQYVAMAEAYVAQLEERLPKQDTARGGMAQDIPAPSPLKRLHDVAGKTDSTPPTGGFGGFSKFGPIQFAGNLFDEANGVYRPVKDGSILGPIFTEDGGGAAVANSIAPPPTLAIHDAALEIMTAVNDFWWEHIVNGSAFKFVREHPDEAAKNIVYTLANIALLGYAPAALKLGILLGQGAGVAGYLGSIKAAEFTVKTLQLPENIFQPPEFQTSEFLSNMFWGGVLGGTNTWLFNVGVTSVFSYGMAAEGIYLGQQLFDAFFTEKPINLFPVLGGMSLNAALGGSSHPMLNTLSLLAAIGTEVYSTLLQKALEN